MKKSVSEGEAKRVERVAQDIAGRPRSEDDADKETKTGERAKVVVPDPVRKDGGTQS